MLNQTMHHFCYFSCNLQVVCKHCSEILPYSRGTTNLIKHLSRHHNIYVKAEEPAGLPGPQPAPQPAPQLPHLPQQAGKPK